MKNSNLINSVRSLCKTFASVISCRLELFSVELQEAKNLYIRLIIFGIIGFISYFIGLMFLGFYFIILYWDTHRIFTAGMVLFSYFAIGTLVFIYTFVKMKKNKQPFKASMNEIKEDIKMIKGVEDE